MVFRFFACAGLLFTLICGCVRVLSLNPASDASGDLQPPISNDGGRDAVEAGLDSGPSPRPDPVFAYQGAGHIQCPDVVADPMGYALAWLEVGANATSSVWLALLDRSGAPRAQPQKISGADVVTTCPRILLADPDLAVFWNRSDNRIVHTAFAIDGQQRLPPHEEAAGSGADELQVGWSGDGYGVAITNSGGTPAFRLYDRDFVPQAWIDLSSTASLWNKDLCTSEDRYLVAHANLDHDELELSLLASDGSTEASRQIADAGRVVTLVCGTPRALMVTATNVGSWRRLEAHQLDSATLDALDGPLLLAEIALEAVDASGVTSDSGWQLAFESRAPTGVTQIQLVTLPASTGFGLSDGGVGADSALPRFDSSLPSGLDILTFGQGYRPRLGLLAPHENTLLVFTDNTQQPQRLVSYLVP